MGAILSFTRGGGGHSHVTHEVHDYGEADGAWQESAKAMPTGAGPTCRSWHVPKPLLSFRASFEIEILRFSLHSLSHEDTIRGTKGRGGRKDASSACCTAHLTPEGLDITLWGRTRHAWEFNKKSIGEKTPKAFGLNCHYRTRVWRRNITKANKAQVPLKPSPWRKSCGRRTEEKSTLHAD